MKRLLLAAALAATLSASPAQAQYGCGHNFCCPGVPPINFCLNTCLLDFNITAGGGRTQLGPWYQYWPYQAHFQTPVPLGANMPQMSYQTLPPGFGQAGWGGYPYGVPTYWYGH